MLNENSQQQDERLEAIKAYIDRKDYRSAEEVWERLNDEWKAGKIVYTRATLDELLDEITRGSSELVKKIIADIEDASKQNRLDERSVENILYNLQRALLRAEHNKYDIYERRLKSQLQLNKENALFDDIQRSVQRFWDEAIARQIDEPTIKPQILLTYYTQALEEATHHLTSYENSTTYSESFKNRLRALHQEAQKRRDSISVAEESLTSGQMVGDYIKTLSYIRDVPADVKVQIYNQNLDVEDTTDKAQAYETYSQRALEFTKNKIVEYIEGGSGRLGIRTLLEQGRPRDAQALYKHYSDTFGELEAKYVPQITQSAERQELFRQETQITEALDRLERVERACENIRQQVDTLNTRADLISTWNEYKNSLREYPLAENSSQIVKDTYNALKNRFARYLTQLAVDIDVAIQSTEFDQARRLINENRSVLEIELVKDGEQARRITGYEDELKYIDQQLSEIETEITQLSMRLNTDTAANLKVEINRIRDKYPIELLKKRGFENLEAQVIARDSALEDVQRLENFLTSVNMNEVNQKASYARQKANENPVYSAIAAELEAYYEFMQAENEALDERIKLLSKILNSGRIANPSLKQRITNAYDQAQELKRRTEANAALFRQAGDALANQDYQTVWRNLHNIQVLNNVQEEEKWTDLFVQSINAYPLDVGFDANLLVELGEFSRKVSRAYLPQRYTVLVDVQRAREKQDIQETIEDYEKIRTRLSGKDAQILDDMINDLRQKQFDAESTRLLSQRPVQGNLDEWLIGLSEYAQKAIDLARRHPNQAVGYYATSLKLDMLFVQNTPIEINRTAIAKRAEETATRLNNLLAQPSAPSISENDVSLLNAASRMMEIVMTINDMIKVITKTESNIQRFKEILDKLRSYFDAPTGYRNLLRDFASLYDDHINRVYGELSDENNKVQPSERYTPKAFLRYVKMLLLKPNAQADVNNAIQVEQLKSNFVNQLQNTFQAFMGRADYKLSDAVYIFDDQYKDLQKFITIVQQASLSIFEEFTESIRDIANTIPKLTDIMQQFDVRVKEFESDLDSYQLDYDKFGTYEGDINNRYANLQKSIRTLFEDLRRAVRIQNFAIPTNVETTHPIMNELQNKMRERQQQFATIIQNWLAILSDASKQEFDSALRRMEQFENLADIWQLFQSQPLYLNKLPNRLELPSADGGDTFIYLPNVAGYEALKRWLSDGIATNEQVSIWRKQHEGITTNLSQFNNKFQNAQQQMQKGEFSKAQELLNDIIQSSDEDEQKKYENIPYLARRNGQFVEVRGVKPNYDFVGALQACPYDKSKHLIETAKEELETLRQWHSYAQNTLKEYTSQAQTFAMLENQFATLFNQLQAAAKERRRNNPTLQNLQAQMYGLLNQMAQIAPQSQAYKGYQNRFNALVGG